MNGFNNKKKNKKLELLSLVGEMLIFLFVILAKVDPMETNLRIFF